MEQYFSKQLANCCHLKFSQPIIKSQKVLLSPQVNASKPLNFTKKTQKKSLKRISSDRAIQLRKNPFKQSGQTSKKQLQEKIQNEYIDDYGNFRNLMTKAQGKIQNSRFSNLKGNQVKQRNHKSLEKTVINQQKPKRNLIQDLKNYRLYYQTPTVTTNLPKIEFIHPKVVQQVYPINNFRQTMIPLNFAPPLTESNKLIRSSSIDQKCFIKPINLRMPQPNFIKFNTPQRQVATFSHQINPLYKTTSPIMMNQYIIQTPVRVNQRHFQNPNKNQFISKPPKINGSSNVNNTNTYSQSFKKIYGQIELQDEIKKDLMTSLDLSMEPHLQNRISNGISRLNKTPSSVGSTMIPSESRLKRRPYESDYYDSASYRKKIRTEQNVKIDDSKLFVGRQQFRAKCERRQKFKSIVSVNSQHGSSTESLDSIIIDQHPQQVVSSQPIKTLL